MNAADVKRAAKLVDQLESLEKASAELAKVEGPHGGKLQVGKPEFCVTGLAYPGTVSLTRDQAEAVINSLKTDVERQLRELRVSL